MLEEKLLVKLTAPGHDPRSQNLLNFRKELKQELVRSILKLWAT